MPTAYIDRSLNPGQSLGKTRAYRNGHIAERTPIIKLKVADRYLKDHPNCTDAEIAQASRIPRRTSNTFHRIARDTPQHLPYVLSGELSLDAAMKRRRKMKEAAPACNGSKHQQIRDDPTRFAVIKLLNDLQAWVSLTK
jgi:hypothetical protein